MLVSLQHFISDALCKFFSLRKSKPSKSLAGCYFVNLAPGFPNGSQERSVLEFIFISRWHRKRSSHEGWENGAKKEKKTAPDKDIWGIYIDISWIEVMIAYQEDAFLQNDSKHYTPNVVGNLFFLAIPTIKPPPPHNPGRKPRD